MESEMDSESEVDSELEGIVEEEVGAEMIEVVWPVMKVNTGDLVLDAVRKSGVKKVLESTISITSKLTC